MTGSESENERTITSTVETRSYSVPFSEVWDAAHRAVSAHGGWSLLDSDSREGTLRMLSVNALGKHPLETSARLWLDDLGQTRLEISCDEPRRFLIPAAAPSRLRRFLRRLEREMGLPGRS